VLYQLNYLNFIIIKKAKKKVEVNIVIEKGGLLFKLPMPVD